MIPLLKKPVREQCAGRHAVAAGRRLTVLTAIVLMGLPAGPARAGVLPEARPLLERLESALDPLKDLEAEFIQVRKISLTDETVEAGGRLRFLVPDCFRIDYREPDRDQLVMWGDSILVYNPELKQAQRNFLDPGDSSRNVLLFFASRRGQLGEKFDVSLGPAGPGGTALRFQPLEGTLDFPISEIQVRLNPKTGLPSEIYIREQEGDSSLFQLRNMRTNRRLTPSDFELKLPPDTEIIAH